MSTAAARPIFSIAGITLGALGLLLAIIQVWAGPFEPAPAVEQQIADKVGRLRTAVIAAIKDEDTARVEFERKRTLDDWARLSTGVLGGLALIFGVIALVRHEQLRGGIGAALLGAMALAFQLLIAWISTMLLIAAIVVVLASLGFG